MRTSEFINEAKGHISNGWCKGAFEDGRGNVCAIASLDRVAMAHLQDDGIRLRKPAEERIMKKVLELFADENYVSIPDWNDRSTTSKEDVEAAFHKAALEAEEEGD